MKKIIIISVYELFGSWRAECQNCWIYSSAFSIDDSLEDLKGKGKECSHNAYGTIYQIKYGDLPKIGTRFSREGDQKFPRIHISNKHDLKGFNLEVISFPSSPKEWEPYVKDPRPFVNYISLPNMNKSNCSACGREYIIVSGHSCADTPNMVQLRTKLAEEIYKNWV